MQNAYVPGSFGSTVISSTVSLFHLLLMIMQYLVKAGTVAVEKPLQK